MEDQHLTDIYLHGALGEEFGRHWRLAVESPAEAVRALSVLRPGFLSAIHRLNAVVEGYRVQVGDYDIGESMLTFPSLGKRIEITPILQGTDTKGILQIVAGVALVAVGIALAWTGAGGLVGLLGAQMIGLGAAIALGGVARLLMSTPDVTATDKTKTRASYLFSGVVNVAGQGECVPILFGEAIIGSAVVSAGMESQDIHAGTARGGGALGGAGGGGGVGFQNTRVQ
jgi:predicted phage tail protein